VPHISTGFPELDALLGIGGLPRGRVCEIVGQPTSGKTTLALQFLARAQAYGPVAYVDQARFFDADYAVRLPTPGGRLDLSRLLVARPYDLVEALAAAEALAQSEALAALVLDVSEAFLGAAPGSAAPSGAEAARQVGALLARLTAPLARSGLALLVIHDGMARAGEPRPYGTDGGRAARAGRPRPYGIDEGWAASGGTPLAHHAAVRLGLRREEWLRRPSSGTLPPTWVGRGDVYGYRAQVEVLKNRLGPSGRSATIEILFE
jgi:recombination protein RecA